MAQRRAARSKPRTLKDYPLHTDIEERSLEKAPNLAQQIELIGEHRRVLDVGCASGYLAKLLVAHGCEVVGIEMNPAAAELAKEHCARVVVADLDATSMVEAVSGAKFDVIVFGDILEHVQEPRRLLEESHGLLNADGFVVASIPNVAHAAVRLSLLHGRFDYQELGILDETHLHFFTRKSIDELFLTAGFRIDRLERNTVPL
ncbi:MAG: class I SAM-dependent methyltransferase, partial [Acidobacteriaceae bacterium]|nr:class I SAM-dependent methyltransferase [Acidobacteriaceae bacterium]